MKHLITAVLSTFFISINAQGQCPTDVTASAANNTICKGGNTQLSTMLLGGCSSYSVTTIPFAAVAGTGTTVTLTNDQVSAALPIGFSFDFFCISYTQFYISSNGFITFTPTTNSGCCQGQLLPNATAPNNLIAFAWEDFNPSAATPIRYLTLGSAPNRKLVMNFNNVPHFGGGGGPVTSQVILYETSNIIEVHTTSMLSDGGLHTMGVEDASGAVGIAAPGRNASGRTTNNNGTRFSPGPPTVTTLTYSWSPAAGLSNPNISNPVASPSITTTYTVTVTDATCPTVWDSITIFADTTYISVSILNPDTFICVGGTVQMVVADTGVATYLWSPAAGLTCTTCSNPLASPTTTTTYYVTVFAALGGCSSKDTITVNTSQLKQVFPYAIPIGVCNPGDPTQLDVTTSLPPSGYCTPITSQSCAGTWEYLINNFSFNTIVNNASGCNGNTNNFIYYSNKSTTVIPGNSYNLSVQSGIYAERFGVWIDYNGDTDFDDPGESVYISPTSATTPFNTSITIPASAQPGTVRLRVRCYYSTITAAQSCSTFTYGETEDYNVVIASSGISNNTYSWSPAVSLSNATIINPIASPSVNTTYTVTVTDTVIGCSLSGIITVSITPATASITPPSQTICNGLIATLTASGGGTYLWSPSAKTTASVQAVITTSYTVTVTNSFGCTDTATATVTVTPPLFPSITGNSTICNGQSATLTANGGGTYSWSPGGQTTQTITPSPTANTLYTVSVTNTFGCTQTATVTVTILPPPVAGFTHIFSGNTVTFTNTSLNSTSWNWDFGDAVTSTLQNPVHIYASSSTYTVTLIVFNQCGSDTSVVVITNVGISEYADNSAMKVYPNPASGKVTVGIQMANLIEGGTLSVINIFGKEIYRYDIPRSANSSLEQKIDFSTVPSGVYLIKIIFEDAVLMQTVVISE